MDHPSEQQSLKRMFQKRIMSSSRQNDANLALVTSSGVDYDDDDYDDNNNDDDDDDDENLDDVEVEEEDPFTSASASSLTPTALGDEDKDDDDDSSVIRLLHIAVVNENVPLVTHLVSYSLNKHHQADPSPSSSSSSSLSSFTSPGSSSTYFREIDCFNRAFQTPLHLAVCTGNVDITRLLIVHGNASLDLVDGNGNSVLHLAVKYNRIAVLKLLIGYLRKQSPPSRILNCLNKDGLSALHLACLSKYWHQVIPLLIKGGSDINVVDGCCGRTPLLYSILNCNSSQDEGYHSQEGRRTTYHRNHKHRCRKHNHVHNHSQTGGSCSQSLQKLLLSLKADPCVTDYAGNSAIDYLKFSRLNFN